MANLGELWRSLELGQRHNYNNKGGNLLVQLLVQTLFQDPLTVFVGVSDYKDTSCLGTEFAMKIAALALSAILVTRVSSVPRSHNEPTAPNLIDAKLGVDQSTVISENRCAVFGDSGIEPVVKYFAANKNRDFLSKKLGQRSNLVLYYADYYGGLSHDLKEYLSQNPNAGLHFTDSVLNDLEKFSLFDSYKVPIDEVDVGRVFFRGVASELAELIIYIVARQPSLLPAYKERLLQMSQQNRLPSQAGLSTNLDEQLLVGLAAVSVVLVYECETQLGRDLMPLLLPGLQSLEIMRVCNRYNLLGRTGPSESSICADLFGYFTRQVFKHSGSMSQMDLGAAREAFGAQIRYMGDSDYVQNALSIVVGHPHRDHNVRAVQEQAFDMVLEGFMQSFEKSFEPQYVKADLASLDHLSQALNGQQQWKFQSRASQISVKTYFGVLWFVYHVQRLDSLSLTPAAQYELESGVVQKFAEYLSAYWTAIQSDDQATYRVLGVLPDLVPVEDEINVVKALESDTDGAPESKWSIAKLLKLSLVGQQLSLDSLMGALTFSIEHDLKDITEVAKVALQKLQQSGADEEQGEEVQPTNLPDLSGYTEAESTGEWWRRGLNNVFLPQNWVYPEGVNDDPNKRRAQIHQLMMFSQQNDNQKMADHFFKAAQTVRARGSVFDSYNLSK
ncbi:hypothetical protein MIR68_003614 [Amoeboaphelidium protococcarum]|nr:hypothetical protein MIR68_003614 [Amoeboaphelidium protococcarum]